MNSTRKAARVAGLLYVLACIPAPFSLIYLPRKLIVPGNATATAANVLASESMFRLGMAGEVIIAIAFIFAVLALYRLLQGVNKRHASLMVTLFAISIPISCLNVLNEVAALILLKGADFLLVFSRPQLDALAMVFLRMHSYGFVVAEIFWGLWLFPFGLLVYRSGILPRFLGVFLIVNCFGYVVPAFVSLLLPAYRKVVAGIALPTLLGELAIVAWFLIMGAKEYPLSGTAEQAAGVPL